MSFADILPFLLLIVLGILALLLLRPRLIIVPEGQRVVIYRMGRVARVVGPGPSWMWVAFESTAPQPLDVRNKQIDIHVPGLMVNGIPAGITFSLWCKFDPVEAAAGNSRRVKELVLFDEAERGRQLQRQIQEAILPALTAVEKGHPLGASSTIVDALLPLLPSTPQNDTFRNALMHELWRCLPRLGFIPDTSHQLVLAGLTLPEDLTKSFGRDRIVSILRLKFPDLPDDRMTAILSAIEGNPLPIKTYVFEGSKAQPKEVRFQEDDLQVLQGFADEPTETPVRSAASPAPPASQPGPAGQPAPGQPSAPPLTAEDWAVLKPLPNHKRPTRRSA